MIDAQTPGQSSSSSGPPEERQAGDSSSTGIKRDEIDEAEEERVNKRRRRRVLASEKRLLGRVSRTCGTGSERRKMNMVLNKLEFNKETFDRRTDISKLIGALDEEISPHEEAEEMGRWRMMYDGYDFYDYGLDYEYDLGVDYDYDCGFQTDFDFDSGYDHDDAYDYD